jgi:serine/threonine-protein kinase TTK/MPS1
MSVLETATAAAGAATTKTREKKKRSVLSVNGKHYSQMDRIGRGGSSAVYRVMAENFKQLALKRVKLEDQDESAVRGYKGEIDLLRKLSNVERVVQLYDWEVDEQRQILSVVSNPVFENACQYKY